MLIPVNGEIAKAFSAPVTKLLEMIDHACTGALAPVQTVRKAKADVRAAKIKVEGSIEIAKILNRADLRSNGEKIRDQKNLEDIVRTAVEGVSQDAKPENIDIDWLAHFLDKCRLTSDEEMQQLWAKILSGEANAVGSFSKRTVGLVAQMSKEDAQNFSNLCSFCLRPGNFIPNPFIFDFQDEVYQNGGCHFPLALALQDAGLVTAQATGFRYHDMPQKMRVRYFDSVIEIDLLKHEPKLEFGKVTFTQSGSQLFEICEAEKNEDFLNYIVSRWKKYRPKIL